MKHLVNLDFLANQKIICMSDRSKLQAQNLATTLRYSKGETVSTSETSKLDSSLKKNAAMATRLKSVTADTSQKLVQELAKLNFTKFIQEFVTSLRESATKCKNAADILGLIDVVSLIHARSSDFLQPFLSELVTLVLPFSHKFPSKATQVKEGVEYVPG